MTVRISPKNNSIKPLTLFSVDEIKFSGCVAIIHYCIDGEETGVHTIDLRYYTLELLQ